MFLHKKVEELYGCFASEVYKSNILDGKIKELIAIAVSIMADCVPCIEYHYKKAVENGATKEEIAEAVAISMSVSSGSKRAKYSQLFNQLGSPK